MNPRITSDMGIDKITDKLNDAAERIGRIGEKMQGLEIKDLDFSKLSKGAQDTLKEIQELQNQLNSNIGAGLQEQLKKAASDGSSLGKVFGDLKVNIKDITAESGKDILSKAFESANEKAHGTFNEIKQLRSEIKGYQSDISNLQNSQSKIDLSKRVQDLSGFNLKDKNALDQDKLQELLLSVSEKINELPNVTDGVKEKLNANLIRLIDESTVNGVKDGVQKIINEISSLDNAPSATFLKNNVFNKTFNDALKEAAIVDPKEIENAKNSIQEVLNTIGSDLGDTSKIKTLLNSGDINGAKEETIRALRNAYQDIEKEINDRQSALETALKTLSTKREELRGDLAARQDVSNAQKDYDGIINDLTAKYQNLADEVIRLREKFENQKSDELKGIKNTGSGAKLDSDRALNEAAKSASLYRSELEQVQAREKMIGKIEGVVQRWFSIYAAVRMVGNAVRSVISTVKELDKTITEIAIVTDMSQDDLWGQMSSYTDMARQYAASISGVYEVSQLYYQQGKLNI